MRPQNGPMTLYVLSVLNGLQTIFNGNMLPLISTNDILKVTIRATLRDLSDWRFEDTVAF